MYINSPQTDQTDDDDLFTRPPRSARRMPVVPMARLATGQTARRACRVCDTSYTVAIDDDGPPLCDGCRADVAATRARVRAWLDGVLDQMDIVLDAWERVRRQHSALWAKLETAMIELPEADLQQRWAARKAQGGAWAALLTAYEDRDVALAPLATERERLERAWDAIREA